MRFSNNGVVSDTGRTMLRAILISLIVSLGIGGQLGAIHCPPDAFLAYGKEYFGPASLLRSRLVLDELRVNKKQKIEIESWCHDFHTSMTEEFDRMMKHFVLSGKTQFLSDELSVYRSKRIKESYSELSQILVEPQIARLRQIDTQVAGLDAITRIDSLSKLNLLNDQREHLSTLFEGMILELAILRHDCGIVTSSRGLGDFKKYEAEKKKLEDAALISFFRTLDEQQRKAYGKICGPAINVASIRDQMS